MDYRIATPADREQVVDFANYVFSQAKVPHDFKTLLPKEYSDHVTGSAVHYLAVRDDGMIRAMVANRPAQMRVGDQMLNVGMVGTVSVHPYARGEGHMKHLMRMMLDDAKEQYDMLALGGLRQRYGYFGFEGACAAAAYTITTTNVRHALRDVDDSAITLTDLTPDDSDNLDFAWSLANQRTIGCVREREAFLDIMHSWNSRMRIIRDGENDIGYVMGAKDDVQELGLLNEQDLFRVIKALFREDGMNRFALTVAPYEIERAKILGSLAENVHIVPQERIRVFNWRKVLCACLTLKAKYADLLNGTVTLKIDENTYTLKVENGKVSVEETQNEPDRILTGREAIQTLFGVESALFRDSAYHDWLPLPLFFSGADTF